MLAVITPALQVHVDANSPPPVTATPGHVPAVEKVSEELSPSAIPSKIKTLSPFSSTVVSERTTLLVPLTNEISALASELATTLAKAAHAIHSIFFVFLIRLPSKPLNLCRGRTFYHDRYDSFEPSTDDF
jgi:hypothetical protein